MQRVTGHTILSSPFVINSPRFIHDLTDKQIPQGTLGELDHTVELVLALEPEDEPIFVSLEKELLSRISKDFTREMSYFSKNPGIGLIVLGLFICTTSIGVSYLYGASVIQIGDFSIEGGPEGPLSGPLFTLGLIVMIIGTYIQVKGSGK